MRSVYKIIILFVFITLACTLSVKGNSLNDMAPPSATITGTTTVCQNAASPVITFTGSGGTAPYTFTYTVTGVGGSQTIATTSGNSVTVSAPTTTIGTFTYNLISVQDATSTQNLNLNAVITVISGFNVTAGLDAFVCKGNTINLSSSVSGNGSNAVAYFWSGPNGYMSNQQSPNIPNSTFAMSGNYTVTASVGNCQVTDNMNITIPEPKIEDLNGKDITSFTECNVTSGDFTFKLSIPSYQSNILNYIISWGDTTSETFTSSSSNPSHTFPIGSFIISIQMNLINGCSVTKTYPVFVGSSPSPATMALFVNQANGCIPHTTEYTFNVPSTNVNGTTYIVSWGDGTPDETYTHPVSVSTLIHTYNISSCGKNVILNGVTYSNVFQPTVITQNPCSTPQPSGSGLIYIGQGPKASFTPSNNNNSVKICASQPLQLNNTSDFGLTIPTTGATCSKIPPFYWEISPSTAGLWTASGLGSNNGYLDNIKNWTLGSMTPSVTFNVPGTYTITLRVKNSCGDSSVSQTFCVEPPLSPSFTVDTNSGCIPLSVITNNTTIPINPCTPPVYTWSVIYAAANCGTTSAYTYTNGTSATSASPSFNFTEAGTYTIKLTATNSCSPPQVATQTITIKKPPTVSINSIANVCQSGSTTSINPTATVPLCANATYAWSFPAGTPPTSALAVPGAISYATAGNHTVSLSVTNECGTTIATNQNFTINPSPTITGTLFSCVGFTSQLLGSATAATTSPWLSSNPAVAAVSSAGLVTGVSGGTTTITYTNANNCKATEVFTVNPAPTITPLVSSTVCLGGTPNVLSFTISGATGTPTFQWYSNTTNSNTGGSIISGETNATFNPPSNSAGTFYYYCIITLPSGGCSNIKTNTATVTIMPNATITTQPTPTQNLCVGVSIPTPLSINYSGGTGTVSYQWFSNTTNSNIGGSLITGATSATYTPPVFTIPGNYYYYATISLNGNGCLPSTSNVAEVIVYADPTITSQPTASQTLCQNATPINLDVTATGGNGTFSYQWYSNSTNTNTGGAPISGATSNSYTPLTSAVGTKYYYSKVSQNSTSGCSVTSATAAIIVISAPTITQPASSTICQGGSPTALSITVSGATGTPTYQWYSNLANNTTTGIAIAGETNNTYNPSAATVGTTYYYCIITLSSGGCSSITSNTATVTINAGATIDTQPTVTQNLCVGATIATPLTITYSGGTGTASYQWYSNTTNLNTGGTLIPSATNASYTPAGFITSGNYYYYVILSFSGNGCGPISSNPAEIKIFDDPIVSSQPLVSQTLCQGATPTNLTVSATGGIGAYSYKWFSSVSNSNTGGVLISGETNNSYTPPTTSVGTTYYYCVITQTGIGCNVTSAKAEVIVNLAPAIVTQPQSSKVCLGKTPTLLSISYSNGVGTPAYQWYSNTVNTILGSSSISGATNATYSPPNSTVGTVYYYCIITLPTGGCSNLTSTIADVTINPNPVISDKTILICSGNSFTITPDNLSGDTVPTGTTYTWSNPTISPTGSITGASAQNIQQMNISQTLTNTTTSPATVTYTVTPISGICKGTNFTIVVTVNPAISPNVTSNNSVCFGVNNGAIQTNITGGIPFSTGYQISWTSPNGFTSNAPNISNLAPGDYTLSVIDAGGCPFSKTYTITEPSDIVISTDLEKDITCFNAANGEIKITLSGGTLNYKIAWTKNGTPYATAKDLSNLSPGIYKVTVSDANNCSPKTATFTITEPPILAVNLVNKNNVLCFGEATGDITVNIVGGTLPYAYSWTGPNGFTSSNQNLTALFAGTYNLIVTDNSGCAKNLSAQLTQTPEIIIKATTTPIICYGDNNASISIVVSGGVSPYQISWSNLGSGTFQDNLSAGDYLITVTDALNCTKKLNVNIPEAPIFTINPVVKNISCFGAKNGSITLNFVGGIPPVKLVWSDSAVAGTTRNNLGPGSYTVTITDGKPCTITRTFIVLEPQLLVLYGNLTNALDCNNANSGAINLIVAGGSVPFTYSWSNGATTEDLANIPAGNYLVTVTDVNGCSKQVQYSINRPPPIITGVVTKTDFDCDTKSVKQTFVAQVSGGVPPYQLVWSNGTVSGTNNEMMNTTQNGTVILYVTDAIGCKSNYTFNVNVPKLGTPSFSASSYAYSTYGIYSINDPIQFINTATGDYTSLIWDFGDGITSTELNPIHAFINPKDYVVTQTVTYPFGCVYVQKITLIVGKGYVLVVPNAFTPNNDNLNDFYRPMTKALKKVHLDIYDTWGSIIYSETGDVLKGWDGKIKVSNAENGNYYCRVSGETFYGTIVNENHPFVLIK